MIVISASDLWAKATKNGWLRGKTGWLSHLPRLRQREAQVGALDVESPELIGRFHLSGGAALLAHLGNGCAQVAKVIRASGCMQHRQH